MSTHFTFGQNDFASTGGGCLLSSNYNEFVNVEVQGHAELLEVDASHWSSTPPESAERVNQALTTLWNTYYPLFVQGVPYDIIRQIQPTLISATTRIFESYCTQMRISASRTSSSSSSSSTSTLMPDGEARLTRLSQAIRALGDPDDQDIVTRNEGFSDGTTVQSIYHAGRMVLNVEFLDQDVLNRVNVVVQRGLTIRDGSVNFTIVVRNNTNNNSCTSSSSSSTSSTLDTRRVLMLPGTNNLHFHNGQFVRFCESVYVTFQMISDGTKKYIKFVDYNRPNGRFLQENLPSPYNVNFPVPVANIVAGYLANPEQAYEEQNYFIDLQSGLNSSTNYVTPYLPRVPTGVELTSLISSLRSYEGYQWDELIYNSHGTIVLGSIPTTSTSTRNNDKVLLWACPGGAFREIEIDIEVDHGGCLRIRSKSLQLCLEVTYVRGPITAHSIGIYGPLLEVYHKVNNEWATQMPDREFRTALASTQTGG